MKKAFIMIVAAFIALSIFPQPAKHDEGKIERKSDEFNQLISENAFLEKVSEGFDWSEGPAWNKKDSSLLFSDIRKNTIYRWKENEGTTIYLRPSGFAGEKPPGRGLGANGLAFNSDGELILCDHGNRMVSKLNEENFTKKPLATHYNGKRLNSPNDLVISSKGEIFFTDPPFGIQKKNYAELKEIDFNGVYKIDTEGNVHLLISDIPIPNGIALSPDEKTLYVTKSGKVDTEIRAYNIDGNGNLDKGRTFFNTYELTKKGLIGPTDGMTIDYKGNLFASGPGGILVISPKGKLLGIIHTGQKTSNCTFGNDGSVLYITADMYVLRIKTNTKGLGF